MSRYFVGFLLAAAMATVFAGSSQAAEVSLASTKPDVFVDLGSITYTASTHTFVVTGAAEFVTNGSQTSITNGTFNMTVLLHKVSGSGPTDVFTPGVGSSLSIIGNGGTVYFSSNNLINFGYSTALGTDHFQFVFSNGSGIEYKPGWNIGVQLQGQGGTSYLATTTGLDASFGEVGRNTATADIFNVPVVVPLPTALWGGTVLLVGLGLVERRRRKLIQV